METKDFIKSIKEMTVLELSELVKAIEEEFGVSAAAPIAQVVAAAPVVAEKSSFNVILKDSGSSKINVIKVVKSITGLGLKEAKDLVDAAPKAIKENVAKAEAEDLKKQLEEAGATVELI